MSPSILPAPRDTEGTGSPESTPSSTPTQTTISSSRSTAASASVPPRSGPGFLPNAAIPGPVPDDFNFDDKIVVPGCVACFQLPLAVRIRENVRLEEHNNASILKTVTVKHTPTPRPADLDIGPPLKPLFFYSDDELQELVESEALCALFSPLPASLLRIVVATRAKTRKKVESERRVQKEKDKQADASILSKILEIANPS
ncbi:hypothetical protein C0992_003595 [Termitomyces sp. T32_za158]|nr:hypothetical protein C0992_003595 [Termitomyces sp. T32_za158]